MESLDHINDMDELFRRAGEDYPLKTGESEWEKISTVLAGPPVTRSSVLRNGLKKYFFFLLIFSLITISLLFYVGDPRKNQHRSSENRQNNSVAKTDRPARANTTIDGAVNSEQKNKDRNKVIPRVNSSVTIGSRTETPGETVDGLHTHSLLKNYKQSLNTTNEYSKELLPYLNTIFLGRWNISTVDAISEAHLRTDQSFNTGINPSNNTLDPRSGYNKGVYLGLLVGTGFSKIKSQPIDGTGYNAGFIAGYRFNRKLSFESGIWWTSKKYYTDGKFFSMNKVGQAMPATMKIIGLDGKLTLFEVPVKLKYDFLHNDRNSLFFVGGITSLVVLKEHNNYLTEMNGVQEHHIGLYKDLSSSLASLIDISAGYEHSFGKSGTIRLEPYIKIPLKKVGMGSMPVFSTGINICILKAFRQKTINKLQ